MSSSSRQRPSNLPTPAILSLYVLMAMAINIAMKKNDGTNRPAVPAAIPKALRIESPKNIVHWSEMR